jgi:hypothetical protein
MVAKYPVDTGDEEGIVDAVNYLLSGPAGLGQNFDGYSAYKSVYLRPSSRQPWTLPITVGDPPTAQPLDPSIYIALPISNITTVGGNPSQFFTVTFTTPQATALFQFGDRLDISGVIETGGPTSFNDISFCVFSCTTTEVVLGYNGDFPSKTWATYVSGGTIGRNYTNYPLETDANARVSVQGGTDRVFINGQINLSWDYTCNTNTTYGVRVSIVRLTGFPSTTPGSAEYLFADTILVTEKITPRTVTVGSGTDALETIFTSVLDGPNLNFGYYWYILRIQFDVAGTAPAYDVDIGRVTLGLRSLTAQAVKE